MYVYKTADLFYLKNKDVKNSFLKDELVILLWSRIRKRNT